ncbi:secreted RxLR effector protein 161-like [Bidens hawaiensis]|uniref:secreted RxLR effector protein 161-like n=1 Tax=Bidens hawaiensis TaxID=980011 RepID=UPI00404AE702
MKTSNLIHVPMDSGMAFSKAEKEIEVDPTEHRKVVGCLRYLLHTRPDLAYSVGVVSRYMQSPCESHGLAIKQILQFVKGTSGFGIEYKRGGTCTGRLIGFCDSSHNIDPDDGWSTAGFSTMKTS